MGQSTKQPTGLKLTRPDGTLCDSLLIRTIPSLYTLSQISQYLATIGIQLYDTKTFLPTLENLKHLVRLHILAFPFENTPMHYTPDHQMDITPEGAFRRLVVERGGSYCFGHGTVFLQVLRGLGYRAYAGCARVNEALDMTSAPILSIQDHMILFVQPFPLCSDKKDQTYLVDPWLGLRTPVRPILLSDREDNIVMGASPYERHRLTRSPHPSSSLDFSAASAERADFCWNVEYQGPSRKGDTPSQWFLLFTFTENEFFPEDAEAYSFVVCNKPGGALRSDVTAVRHLSFEELDEAGLEEAAKEFAQYSEVESKTFLWQYTLSRDKVKRRVGSNSNIIQTLENKADKIRVLRELFGIVINEDSCSHFAGGPSSLN